MELPKARSRVYNIWSGMKRRCDDPNFTVFSYYGGKGIGYCDRWSVFKNFWADMAEGYSDDLTLERIDNTKGYSPENCRWATMKEQTNNTSRNRFITIEGVTKTLSQWVEYFGLKGSTVRQRYYVYGWSAEKSLGIGG